MAYFDRFDICEAYAVLEWNWHSGGVLWERPSNIRRGEATGFRAESTDVQLRRMRFKPRPNLSYETLSENAREIYHLAAERFGLEADQVNIRYRCPECGHCWEETYECACDSECPTCGTRNITALQYKDADEEWTAEDNAEWVAEGGTVS